MKTSNGGTIFEKRTSPKATARGVLFMFSGCGFLLQLADDPSGWANYQSPSFTGCNDGLWHLVTLSVDRDSPTGGKVYVDDRLVWTFNPTARKGTLTNPAPLTIGDGYDQPTLGGAIDEMTFWSKALTEAEILALYDAGSDGMCR